MLFSTTALINERAIFGPTCVGLVGGSAFVVYAIYVMIRDRKKDTYKAPVLQKIEY